MPIWAHIARYSSTTRTYRTTRPWLTIGGCEQTYGGDPFATDYNPDTVRFSEIVLAKEPVTKDVEMREDDSDTDWIKGI